MRVQLKGHPMPRPRISVLEQRYRLSPHLQVWRAAKRRKQTLFLQTPTSCDDDGHCHHRTGRRIVLLEAVDGCLPTESHLRRWCLQPTFRSDQMNGPPADSRRFQCIFQAANITYDPTDPEQRSRSDSPFCAYFGIRMPRDAVDDPASCWSYASTRISRPCRL